MGGEQDEITWSLRNNSQDLCGVSRASATTAGMEWEDGGWLCRVTVGHNEADSWKSRTGIGQLLVGQRRGDA